MIRGPFALFGGAWMIGRAVDLAEESPGAAELARAVALTGVGRAGLFAAGPTQALAVPMISFGGSRQAPPGALAAIEHLAALVALAGGLVVSGGAFGTDCAAHRGALGAGASTVLVLPCPIEDIEPTTWRPELCPLWDAERMVFVSPFAAGRAVQRGFPLVRNRLVAALAGAAVAGHTALQGGTNHFIGEVLQLGAPLFMLDQRTADPRLRTALDRLHRRGVRFFSPAEAHTEALAIEIVEAARDYTRRRPMPGAPGQTTLFDPAAEYTVL